MPQDLIQYGALGVLVIVLIGGYDLSKRFSKLIGNHLDHDLEDRKDDRKSRDAHTEVLAGLKTIIEERLPK